jgi:hypothetical protein
MGVVISHDHKFIYLPIPKTGSRTIRTALAAYGAVTVQYHCQAWQTNHQCVTPEEYDDYFTFASIRSPFRRALSIYLYNQQTPGNDLHKQSLRLNFTEFVHTHWAAIDSQVAILSGLRVDNYVIYEQGIETELRRLLPFIGNLTIQKRNAVIYHQPWKTYFTEEAIEFIILQARSDFEQFSYPRQLA